MKLKKFSIQDVRDLAQTSRDQAELVVGIYKLVFPDWDDILELNGYPKANECVCSGVLNICRSFDRKHHPGIMPGGAWGLCYGFSLDNTVPDGYVDISEVNIYYKRDFRIPKGYGLLRDYSAEYVKEAPLLFSRDHFIWSMKIELEG